MKAIPITDGWYVVVWSVLHRGSQNIIKKYGAMVKAKSKHQAVMAVIDSRIQKERERHARTV